MSGPAGRNSPGTRFVAQDNLALWAKYGDLYNEIVRPDRKYTISHYLRTQWGPLLGPARLWFVVALRQRCFWNDRQDWCVVDIETLAQETGLSRRTINRIVEEGNDAQSHIAPFFTRVRRSRYSERAGRTVNAPSRYQVLLDDPLTPADQARLALYLRRAVADGTPATTLDVLQDLCDCSEAVLDERLRLPGRGGYGALPGQGTPPADFVLDVVGACCPLPPQEEALYVEIARAASRLHNRLTRPERVYMGNQYFRLNWLPVLGPASALLVVNLRACCYWNEQTGELRDVGQENWGNLAREMGCTTRQLHNLRQNPHLARFITLLEEGRGPAPCRFRVEMADPLTEADQARFDRACQALPDQIMDPETGQLGIYALLTAATLARRETVARQAVPGTPPQDVPFPAGAAEGGGDARQPGIGTMQVAREAEILAPGQEENLTPGEAEALAPGRAEILAPGRAEAAAPGDVLHRDDGARRQDAEILAPGKAEVLAPGMRKFWHLEGLHAEILAHECGNFGTNLKLLIITPSLKGPTASTVHAAIPSGQPRALDEELLAVAALDQLLTQLTIQEPGKSRLLARRPRCDHAVAWGLYALTQPGLDRNKAGFVYRRLLDGDLPPADLLTLAALKPSEWRLFYHARRTRQPHLASDLDLRWKYALWCELFDPVWGELAFDLGADDALSVRASGDGVHRQNARLPPSTGPAQELEQLPAALRDALLDGDGGGHVPVEQASGRWVIATGDLYQAYRLACTAAGHPAWPVDVCLVDDYGQRHPLNAEILALGEVAPLDARAWRSAVAELRLQMTQAVFDRWWSHVKPLGIVRDGGAGGGACVLLGVPAPGAQEWLAAWQSVLVARTLSGVLGEPVRVQFVVYSCDN